MFASLALGGGGSSGALVRRFGFWLGVVVSVGVAIRVSYTVLVAPWPPRRITDEFWYSAVPQLVAHGRGFIRPDAIFGGPSVPTAAHAPLYPVVLAGLAKLGGTGADAQRLAGSVFGAGTITAVGLLGRRIGGERAGLLAAGLAAVYPILITADGALMSESLFGFLVAGSLLAAYRLLEAPTAGRAIVLGVLAGLAALTRGEALLLLALVLVPVIRRPRGVRAAVIACVTLVVVLMPWTVRNWIVFDRFVLITNDTGTAIASANCHATYYGNNVGGTDPSCIKYSSGNEAVKAANAQSDGVRYALHHVDRVPPVAATRLLRVWGLSRPMEQTGEGRSPAAQNAGVVTYYLLVPLAIYGLLLLRRRHYPVWILTAPLVLVSVVAVLVFGQLRLREPAEPSLVVLAGIALNQLWNRSTAPTSGAQPSRANQA